VTNKAVIYMLLSILRATKAQKHVYVGDVWLVQEKQCPLF